MDCKACSLYPHGLPARKTGLTEALHTAPWTIFRSSRTAFSLLFIMLCLFNITVLDKTWDSFKWQIMISLYLQLFSLTNIFIDTLLWVCKAMAPHSSTLAWKIPWAEEPGRLQSLGLLRVGHDWATSLSLFTFMHWRRKWQPTPVFLPGESQGRGSLVGCRLWGHTELDMTEVT